jgi:hypothetical protein
LKFLLGVFWIRLMLNSCTASRRCAWLRYQGTKAVHGEGYYSIEELIEAATEEYDGLVQFEQAEELEMVA